MRVVPSPPAGTAPTSKTPAEDPPMTPSTDPWMCTTCRAEIRHRPTFHVGLAFCCAGCVADGPCICSYDLPTDEATVATEAPAEVVAAERVPAAA